MRWLIIIAIILILIWLLGLFSFEKSLSLQRQTLPSPNTPSVNKSTEKESMHGCYCAKRAKLYEHPYIMEHPHSCNDRSLRAGCGHNGQTGQTFSYGINYNYLL